MGRAATFLPDTVAARWSLVPHVPHYLRVAGRVLYGRRSARPSTQRLGLVGLTAFLALVAIVLTVIALVITWRHDWHSFGHFLSSLSAVGPDRLARAVCWIARYR